MKNAIIVSLSVSLTLTAGTSVTHSAPPTSPVRPTSGPTGVTVTFHDDTFNSADWELIPFFWGTGGSIEVAQVQSGGNPGSYRWVKDTVNTALPGNESGAAGFHRRVGASYDPSRQGPITAIAYAEDSILLSGFPGSEGQATGPALRQSGRVFIGQELTTPERSWTSRSRAGFVESDFILLADTGIDLTVHPDFSAAGSLIEFGFYRANSTPIGGTGYAIVGGIDNWSITVTSSACSPLPLPAASWWPADGHEADLVGANDGTLLGGATFAAGFSGQAFNFDGVDDYVEIPNAPSLNPAEQISVGAWYRPLSFRGAGTNPIVDKGYAAHVPPYYQYHLGVSGDRYPSTPASFDFSVALNGTLVSTTSPLHEWVPGHWYFVVGTYDGSYVRLYVNGRLRASQVATGSLADYGRDVRLGAFTNAFSGSGAGYLPGLVDEVFISSRALTPCEISSAFLAYSASFCRGDADQDGIPDYDDNCPQAHNAAQENTDGDLAGDGCDCDPADPTAIANVETDGVVVRPNRTTVEWCSATYSAGPSTHYDVSRGLVSEFPVGTGAHEVCVGSVVPLPEVEDSLMPNLGDGFWYLVRGRNSCGIGTYGSTSVGMERVTSTCP